MINEEIKSGEQFSFARTLYFQCCYKSRKYFTISNLFYTNIFTINIFLLLFLYIWHEAELW